jgi:tagatose 1,6-diphosphate aldolase
VSSESLFPFHHFPYDTTPMRLWFGHSRKTPPFQFLEPGALVDRELELIEPAVRWIDAHLQTFASPASVGDPSSHLTRADLLRFVDRYPRGRESPNPLLGRVPAYTFWLRLKNRVPVEIAGSVSLRIGQTEDLRRYLGHIGYGVYPPARGHHYAERATRLLFPLARAHGLHELWVTANPDNIPSRRTCERLGGRLVDVVDLPITHPLFLRGDRRKCRYQIVL